MNLARDINKAYQELDLIPGASLDEVKEAYRRLARALHPDLHPGALGSLMSRVNQAYDKLVRHLEGQHPHQAGPAKASNRKMQDSNSHKSKSRTRQYGFKAYEYEEFRAERGAHGEHARRNSAWQDLKRRFYDQAKQAAQAAAQAAENSRTEETAENDNEDPPVSPATTSKSDISDEAQVISPSDPRVAGTYSDKQEEEPVAGPVGLSWRSTEGWRLLGLDKQDDVLLYRVELSGSPSTINLPVRCCRTCHQCDGSGRHEDTSGRLQRCPACGGKGRIARADRVEVELPRDWRPGLRIQVPACNRDNEIQVELIPA
jgi:DnaJ-class molecular chaperone